VTSLEHAPCIAVIGALLMLSWGLVRHSLRLTVGSLLTLVAGALLFIPVFLEGPRNDASLAAMVGLESAAGVALAGLFVWRTTRRYPLFPAGATLILGVAASVLVVRATFG
jgi:uncharacterized membrane protein